MAAVSGVRACPDLRPCLTLVPTKPCDETRPQERGFNKRYRFLELRLGDFPEDRLCLAGGLRAAGTRLPLSSSALSTAATLDLSLTTWKSSPLGAGPPGWVSVSSIPGNRGQGRSRGSSQRLWDARGRLDQAGTPGVQKLTPSLTAPAKGSWRSGWAQIYWQQQGHKCPVHFICPPGWTLGRPTVPVPVLLAWKSRAGGNPTLAGARGSVRNVEFFGAFVSGWL